MSKYQVQQVPGLHDPVTGALVGFLGLDGREYFLGVSPANAAALPTFFNPSSVAITGGTINSTAIGNSGQASMRTNNLQASRSDLSGTPGNGTANTTCGRAAIAAGQQSCTITNSLVTTTSTVLVTLGGLDATMFAARCTPGAGSFVVTGNVAATGNVPFDWLVITP